MRPSAGKCQFVRLNLGECRGRTKTSDRRHTDEHVVIMNIGRKSHELAFTLQ
jgi:hypothetical protein